MFQNIKISGVYEKQKYYCAAFGCHYASVNFRMRRNRRTVVESSATETETVAEVTTDPNDRSGYQDSLPEDIDLGGITLGVYCVKTSGDTDFIMWG